MMPNRLFIIHTAGIDSGGGREYLKYVLNAYKSKNYFVFLDSRLDPKEFNIKNYTQYKNNLSLRINIFLMRIKWKIERKVDLEELFLNGIPPLFKINSSNKVIILFQNVLLLNSSYNHYLSNFNKIKFTLIRLFIKNFLNHSYEVLVQTKSMVKHFKNFTNKKNKIIIDKGIHNDYFKHKFLINYNIEKLRLKYNFFYEIENLVDSKNIIYFYPASFLKHKNHIRLIKAFEILPANIKKNIFILLTIKDRDIQKLTDEKNIMNLGKINRNFVNYLLKNSNFLVFPSLIESLGIPLLEAKYSKLKIISSNIDVISEVSDPLIKFNPENIYEISSALLTSYNLAIQK